MTESTHYSNQDLEDLQPLVVEQFKSLFKKALIKTQMLTTKEIQRIVDQGQDPLDILAQHHTNPHLHREMNRLRRRVIRLLIRATDNAVPMYHKKYPLRQEAWLYICARLFRRG